MVAEEVVEGDGPATEPHEQPWKPPSPAAAVTVAAAGAAAAEKQAEGATAAACRALAGGEPASVAVGSAPAAGG
jgi:hypothetical protein